jgi:hypothetical protein
MLGSDLAQWTEERVLAELKTAGPSRVPDDYRPYGHAAAWVTPVGKQLVQELRTAVPEWLGGDSSDEESDAEPILMMEIDPGLVAHAVAGTGTGDTPPEASPAAATGTTFEVPIRVPDADNGGSVSSSLSTTVPYIVVGDGDADETTTPPYIVQDAHRDPDEKREKTRLSQDGDDTHNGNTEAPYIMDDDDDSDVEKKATPLCCVCLAAPADTLVMPCMHQVVCRTCSTQLMATPQARYCLQCTRPIVAVLMDEHEAPA